MSVLVTFVNNATMDMAGEKPFGDNANLCRGWGTLITVLLNLTSPPRHQNCLAHVQEQT